MDLQRLLKDVIKKYKPEINNNLKLEIMIITIALLALIGIGIYLIHLEVDLLGILLSAIFFLYLIVHLLCWSLSSYDYNIFVEKRNSFVETLEYARENESKFELASITRDVSEWNQKLATFKYQNKLFLLKDYVDDRMMDLEPIK